MSLFGSSFNSSFSSSDLKRLNKMSVCILAAGRGTRLHLPMAKPLAPILGSTLLGCVLNELKTFSHLSLVLNHQKQDISTYIANIFPALSLSFVNQPFLAGTGHALKCFLEQGDDKNKNVEWVLVTCGDTPLITESDYLSLIEEVMNQFENDPNCVGGIITTREVNPYGYGRVLTKNSKDSPIHKKKYFERIESMVEEKEATQEEKKINLIYTGVMLVKKHILEEFCNQYSESQIQNNYQKHKKEFYLTDIFSHFQNQYFLSIESENNGQFLGVNTLEQLAQATDKMQDRVIRKWQQQGVYFANPKQVEIDLSVQFKSSAWIHPWVSLKKDTVIEDRVTIHSFSQIISSHLHSHVEIFSHSHIENSVVFEKAQVGPFARLRPLSSIGKESKVGNFVEIKKSQLGEKSKVSHLSYVGDAEIGDHTNIGCGFITCNYDGKTKHKTKIGSHCFIGSDSQTVAPVEIEDYSFVACSTTITDNVPTGTLAISRGRQINKHHLAKKFLPENKNS